MRGESKGNQLLFQDFDSERKLKDDVVLLKEQECLGGKLICGTGREQIVGFSKSE